MIGIIYKTTNLITGKKYIGKRQNTWRPHEFEDYLGSSRLLKEDIERYGEENFTREILATANTKEELAKLEIKHLRESNAVDRDDYYNLTIPRLSWSQGYEKRREDPKITEKRAAAMRGVKRGKYNVKVKYRNLDEERAQKIIDLHNEGLTPWEIHKEIDYSARSITNYLKDQDLVPNKKKGWQSKWTKEEEKHAIDLYRKGMSCKEISKITKRNVNYILVMLKEHNIEIRDGNHYKE